MYPDHVLMEIEGSLTDVRRSQRAIRTIAKDLGLRSTDFTLPDDAMDFAAELHPIQPEGPVYRGGITFPFVVTCFDQTHRRLARLVYATSLGSEIDTETGEVFRDLHSTVSTLQVLLLDRHQNCFTWEGLDMGVFPPSALNEFDKRMFEAALAQEGAVLGN
jgi:hypothetical protein